MDNKSKETKNFVEVMHFTDRTIIFNLPIFQSHSLFKDQESVVFMRILFQIFLVPLKNLEILRCTISALHICNIAIHSLMDSSVNFHEGSWSDFDPRGFTQRDGHVSEVELELVE